MRVLPPLLAAVAFALTGCSLTPTATPAPQLAAAIRGNVYGGQQPIAGAHIYLFAASSAGYGSPSTSLLSSIPGSTFQDTSGGPTNGDFYTTTNPDGSFLIAGDYLCTPATQVYLYALGGNPGSGPNPASGLLAILGNCPASQSFLTTAPFVLVNEVSTIAAAYAFAGFATDATHVASSGTPLAQTGIANAFANAANLASIATGTALAATPNGNGTVPQAEIDTLANILAACVNTTGLATGNCGTLFANAAADGTPTGAQPTETATAAINIAHYPGAHTAALYALAAPQVVFAPALTTPPNNFTIALQFKLGSAIAVGNLAVDASGNLWVSIFSQASGYTADFTHPVTELSPTGALLAPTAGYGNIPNPAQFQPLAIDPNGNVWVAAYASNFMDEYSPAGAQLSPPSGFTGGGLTDALGLAIDGLGDPWIANGNVHNLAEFNNAGVPITTSAGYPGNGLNDAGSVAIDGLGNTWAISYLQNSATRLNSSGTVTGYYTAGGLANTLNLAIDSANSVWVVDETSTVKISSAGTYLSGASGFTAARNGAIAIDGNGNVFVSNQIAGTLTELTNAGTVVPGAATYSGGAFSHIYSLAVDPSGNLWSTAVIGVSNPIFEILGIATPVVTPLSVGSKNNTLGTRP